MDDESRRLFDDLMDGQSGAETEIYNRYAKRLIALANKKISEKLKPRFDGEDVVQSAYRSFFRKAKDEQIVWNRSGDLWRTLATFTYFKTLKRIEKETGDGNHSDREVHGSAWIDGLKHREPTSDEVANVIDLLQHYMERLNPRNRFILELRLRGESVAEIGEELKNHTEQFGEKVAQIKDAVIRKVIRDAKRELKAMLDEE